MNPLAELKGCKTTSTSIEPPMGMGYEDWRIVLLRVRQLGDAFRWWYGQLVLFGEAHYGEIAAQAVSETGLDEETIMRYRTVAERIDERIRIRELSWSHHREVAYTPNLTMEDRQEWLVRAYKNAWTVRELKEELELEGLRNHKAKSAHAEECGICHRPHWSQITITVCQSCYENVFKR